MPMPTLSLNRADAKTILARRITPRPPLAPSARPPETRPDFRPTGAKPSNRNRPRPKIIEAAPDAPWWGVRRIGNDVFHGPMIRHASKESAVVEARRLAQKHQGVRFCVLESVASFVAEQPVPAPAVAEDAAG